MPTGYSRDGSSLGNNAGLRAWRESRSENSASSPKKCTKCGEPVTKLRVNSTKPRHGSKYYVRLCEKHLRELDQHKYEQRAKRRYGVGRAPSESRCAICGRKAEVVDHCHESGKFRAYLCNKCNRGIGFLNDDPLLVLKAADYLIEHKRG